MVNAKLRIDFNQEVHVIRHDFEFKDVCPMLRRLFADQFFEPNIGAIHQDFASLFRTPDDVSIRFVFMEPVYHTSTAYCVEEKNRDQGHALYPHG